VTYVTVSHFHLHFSIIDISQLPVNLCCLAEASLVICLGNKKTQLGSTLRQREHCTAGTHKATELLQCYSYINSKAMQHISCLLLIWC